MSLRSETQAKAMQRHAAGLGFQPRLGTHAPNNRAPRKKKLDVLNKRPTVLRAREALEIILKRDGLDSVPYFWGPKNKRH